MPIGTILSSRTLEQMWAPPRHRATAAVFPKPPPPVVMDRRAVAAAADSMVARQFRYVLCSFLEFFQYLV